MDSYDGLTSRRVRTHVHVVFMILSADPSLKVLMSERVKASNTEF